MIRFVLLRLFAALLTVLIPGAAAVAQPARASHIHASLIVEAPARPGSTATLAVVMQPDKGWHGYWQNPGDAGLPVTLQWTLPKGVNAGTPQFPVPQTLLVSGLMNHVYEHDYAVLVPLAVPAGAAPGSLLSVSAKANWLACTDEICVPEQADLATTVQVSGPGAGAADPRFAAFRAALPALLDQPAAFAVEGGKLRFAVPFPAAAAIAAPHLFMASEGVVDYAAPQAFRRKGDVLIGEVALAPGRSGPLPGELSGVLSLGEGAQGLALTARPGAVPAGGDPVQGAAGEAPKAGATGFWLAVLGALLGGLVLNVMPCVFPILSLKALALARAGDEAHARAEGLAYTAGVIVACVALGAVMLALRAAGEQVGWAFQLQQPGIVLALLLLAVAITANFAGLFELPGLSLEGKPGHGSAFATGLLAAFVATPCTGPFMAAAVGAALVMPMPLALAVFAALGLGLALPFLALGFIPPLRRMLPKPGRWMETFRRVMAVPMGLTVVALVWLASRSGGTLFAGLGLGLAVVLVVVLVLIGRSQRAGWGLGPARLLTVPLVLAAVAATSFAAPPAPSAGIAGAVVYSEAALAKARANGPVFLYFTADWCLSCKVNERVAIDRAETRAAFDKAGVAVVVGDWTRRDPAITRFLTTQGAAGVPLYLWYPKGAASPQQLPQVLTPDLLAGLVKG